MTCTGPNCSKPAYRERLCAGHYRQTERWPYRKMRPLRRYVRITHHLIASALALRAEGKSTPVIARELGLHRSVAWSIVTRTALHRERASC